MDTERLETEVINKKSKKWVVERVMVSLSDKESGLLTEVSNSLNKPKSEILKDLVYMYIEDYYALLSNPRMPYKELPALNIDEYLTN